MHARMQSPRVWKKTKTCTFEDGLWAGPEMRVSGCQRARIGGPRPFSASVDYRRLLPVSAAPVLEGRPRVRSGPRRRSTQMQSQSQIRCVYIYIYIEREIHAYTYIYIYIHIHIYIYRYIYIYIYMKGRHELVGTIRTGVNNK